MVREQPTITRNAHTYPNTGLFRSPVSLRLLHAVTRRIMDQHVYLAKSVFPCYDGLKARQHRIGACAATDGRDDARMPRNRQLRETVVVTRQHQYHAVDPFGEIGRASCRERVCQYV